MTFETNQFYSYDGHIYMYNGKTEFDSGYVLYFFEEVDTQKLLVLGPDEVKEVAVY